MNAIESVHVRGFRSPADFRVDDLPNVTVMIGPNGPTLTPGLDPIPVRPPIIPVRDPERLILSCRSLNPIAACRLTED